ncbi:MAG: ComEC/Rec2 family competence protein [Gordonia sp. (in: high G+C Gram-positive bacteria)]|uniref:ComEC/Rec2 family competence protein n=1 Tax=Gordonia sp. (in: high G+C Gram-positive bacteria) TaxID=84139 RepID=UPI0039E65812
MMSADLRLIPPAVASWLTVVAVLASPTLVATVTVVVLAAAGTVAAVALVRGPRRGQCRGPAAAILAACGIAAAAGTVTLLRVTVADTTPLRSESGKPLVTAVVTADPQFFTARPGARIPVRVGQVGRLRIRPVAADLMMSSPPPELTPGQRIRVRVRVRPPPDGLADRLTAARLTASGDLRVVGEAPVWQRWAGRVRQRLRELSAHAMSPRQAGLLPGLVLGDTSGLDPGLGENFRAAGLTHLVAVSG